MENFKDTAQKCLLNTHREVKQVKHDNQIIGKKVKIWGLIVRLLQQCIGGIMRKC